jgi:alkanesulfonate monooxygenase SsuD/methylene tetrahydromethanopterin reductase-like flavin-dependent oxidoreductase (luciferase family)
MPKLRLGTYVEFQCPPGRDHAELMNDVIRCAEHSDQRGFSVFTTLEHPFFEQFAINCAPLPLFTKLAERTRNLRFRTLCHTLPLHNPMMLAGQIAQADVLTGGRIECGFGRGHAWIQPHANVPFEEAQGRFDESVEILLKGWTEERFSFHGKYYECNDLSIVPKPVQKPHPPIFQVGTSAKSYKAAGERGWSITIGAPTPDDIFVEPHNVYIEACRASGHKPHVSFLKAIYLAEDQATAEREAEEYGLKFIEYNVQPLKDMNRTEEMRERMRAGGFHFYAGDDFLRLGDLSFREIVDAGVMYIGTPEKVAQQLLQLHTKMPYEEFILVSHYGGIPAHKAMQTQELFVKEVLPILEAGIAKKEAA